MKNFFSMIGAWCKSHVWQTVLIGVATVGVVATSIALPIALSHNDEHQNTEHQHAFSSEWSMDNEKHWHAATCEHTDLMKDLAEHVWGDWSVKTPASHVATGLKERECSVCHKVQQEAISPLEGHTFDKEVVDEKYFKSAADCENPAVYYKSCECGAKGTETFESGVALGHDLNPITGKCSRCTYDAGRTVTFEDKLLGNSYIHFAPVGNKIYINFTPKVADKLYFDIEAQQYFDDGIKEEDLDSCLIKDVKLHKDGDFNHEIEFIDYEYSIADRYFKWETVEDLELNTKYYLTLTLDKEYDDFVVYIDDGIDKIWGLLPPHITTTEEYKIYDGEPFIVEATSEEGDVSVIYIKIDRNGIFGTYTPPVEPGDYYAKVIVQTETEYCYSTYDFSIIATSKTISVGESNQVNFNVPEFTTLETKVEVEEGKNYILLINGENWDFEVRDDVSAYEIEFDMHKVFYVITAKRDGIITITGTKKTSSHHLYEVGVYNLIEMSDPYDNNNANNKFNLGPMNAVSFKFTLDAPQPIRLNASLGAEYLFVHIYNGNFVEQPISIVDGFYTTYNEESDEIQCLPAGDYYIDVFNGHPSNNVDINAYLLCMYND